MSYKIPSSKRLRSMSPAELREEIKAISHELKTRGHNEKLQAVRRVLWTLRRLNEVGKKGPAIERTAYHEAGHAVASLQLGRAFKKVSIIPSPSEGSWGRLSLFKRRWSDPEWKDVNLRRYFAYLERSIDKGTQWAVFEPNGEALWAKVRRTIEDFLLNEWQMGALLGEKPEKAFFVKCDRSTMTQNDIDNGRLVCLVGVAALRPAEFVIFRIGQWTADRKS